VNPCLVSVIIPHRSQLSHLKKTIQKCLSQSYSNLEVIIVDDASPIEQYKCLTQAFAHPKIRFLRITSQQGPAHARNQGFSISRGEYIQFLDADDWIHPDKIKLQVQRLQSEPSDFVVCAWRFNFRMSGLNIPFPIISPAPDRAALLMGTARDTDWFPIMCCLFRRQFIDKLGPWHELDYIEDRNYRIRCLIEAGSISVMKECLFLYNRFAFPTRSERPRLETRAREALAQSDEDFNTYLKMADTRSKAKQFLSPQSFAEFCRIHIYLSEPCKPSPKWIQTFLLISRYAFSLSKSWIKQIISNLLPSYKYRMRCGDI
jgi:glycosyltransferase involved in cell wall biosynthesis